MATRDEIFMEQALEEARRAPSHDDVPIGCVVTEGDRVIAAARNEREVASDPTAHAEILALRAAAAARGSWRLDGCTVYVTLEPCAMCAGAMVLARVDRLVIGAMDPKAGASGSLYDIPRDTRLNHRIEVDTGVMADACGSILREFFAARRGGAARG
jgi:tRNA(adenine34) deaminase